MLQSNRLKRFISIKTRNEKFWLHVEHAAAVVIQCNVYNTTNRRRHETIDAIYLQIFKYRII